MKRSNIAGCLSVLVFVLLVQQQFSHNQNNAIKRQTEEKDYAYAKTNIPRIERFISTDYDYLDLWNMFSDYNSIWSYKNAEKIGREDFNKESIPSIRRSIKSLMLNSMTEREHKLKVLSNTFMRAIDSLQNPIDCSKARLLICEIRVLSGFGAFTHHLTNCMLKALYTKRTMIYVHGHWGYNNEGWEYAFHSIGKCTLEKEINATALPSLKDAPWETRIVRSDLRYVPAWIPFTVPTEFAETLLPNHGDPFAWWIGQFVSYLMRPKPWLSEKFEKSKSRIGFVNPCVGIQIRRGDKVTKEANYYTVDEYMFYVEKYFDQVAIDNTDIPRTVYVATEDISVLPELRMKYPAYNYITNQESTIIVSSHKERYNKEGLENVLMDIFFLSQCDYIVCTLSSNVGRVSYELMQNIRADAPERIHSLDIPYRFKVARISHWKAIYDHLPTRNSGELEFHRGSIIRVPYFYYASFNSGSLNGLISLPFGREKPFPKYKARQIIGTSNYSFLKDLKP